jgi:hypothetical protein
MTDGPGRVREADPSHAGGLISEIETLWHAFPLEEAGERVERLLETE